MRTEPVANTIPSASTRMPPAEPIRLITALALERSGLTVTSGISATAGERKVDMATSTIRSSTTKMMSGAGEALVTCQA